MATQTEPEPAHKPHHKLIPHPHVIHPKDLRIQPTRHWIIGRNDWVLEWLSEHVLASMLMFDIALIVPLVVLPMPDSIKITLGVISGSWIQWWALPALQRSQVKADKARQVKEDADCAALTHIAHQVDKIYAKLESK